MAVKGSGQFSLVEALIPDALGRSSRLDRLTGLVQWYRFKTILARLRSNGAGRPAYDPLLMFKALLLQSLYALSDSELEEALADRLSFRRFVGLSLEDRVPDHTTLCRFRNLLIETELLPKLFAELDRQLDEAGLFLRRGTMLDATIIETTAARPRGEDQDGTPLPPRDPDARFTRRKGKPGSSYGYKAHVGVDEGSGLIRRVLTTPANVNDTVPADALICGDEREVLADSAYHTHARAAALKTRKIKPRLMRRANRYQPVLRPRARLFNAVISRRRAAVETTFATLKRRMNLGVIRYLGLAKATAQVLLTSLAFNMRRWDTLTA